MTFHKKLTQLWNLFIFEEIARLTLSSNFSSIFLFLTGWINLSCVRHLFNETRLLVSWERFWPKSFKNCYSLAPLATQTLAFTSSLFSGLAGDGLQLPVQRHHLRDHQLLRGPLRLPERTVQRQRGKIFTLCVRSGFFNFCSVCVQSSKSLLKRP